MASQEVSVNVLDVEIVAVLLREIESLQARVSELESKIGDSGKATITWNSPVVTSMTASDLGREIEKSATRERL